MASRVAIVQITGVGWARRPPYSVTDLTVVTARFLEIYNERVHDLLVGEAPVSCHSLPRRRGNSRKDLRVREHPSRGPYVQNLRRVAVCDIATLLSLVCEGVNRRRTAATRRNSTSSRSHALLELATPQATLHLADLAGSEKANWEGCGDGRQKEGANINKSLVALSNVISALVSGGSKGRFVPYRDSALTWLLRDCFTGGASTFIVATVSPSAACYGESASTLRWAARARQLPTPRTSHTPAVTRAALQAQYNKLLAELARHHIRYVPETGKIAYGDSHWMMQTDNSIQPGEILDKEAKIGNLMNMFNTKTDTNNSESTASSAASGSSEVINIDNTNIKEAISEEVDKLFGPTLERTRSGSDFEVVAPLRNKRRQYKSQEVLDGHNSNTLKATSSQSQEQINETGVHKTRPSPQIPILYDNQRAEIVASVTERLYSKLKKKEEVAVSKMESMVDRKIMEPLSELRICTNARQRLMELSQKAMRNKRRIGIPAHTQTRITVTRVRDQAIDVQTDLEMYAIKKEHSYTLQRDVGTETMELTPRCKEISVGPKCGSLDVRDNSTITDTKQVMRKSSYVMTDIIAKYDSCTQTPILPPPRRRKRATLSKFIKNHDNTKEDNSVAPMISINISQQYPLDSESQSSDDNVGCNNVYSKPTNATMPPDLLTNHNTADTSLHEEDESDIISDVESVPQELREDKVQCQTKPSESENNNYEEFPDSEEYLLPRVTVDSSRNQDNFKDMILGRNKNMYPYNIVLSPPKARENLKRIVKFKEAEIVPVISAASQTNWEWDNSCEKFYLSSDVTNSENGCDAYQDSSIYSDSTDSSKMESKSFIWNEGERLSKPRKTIGNSATRSATVYKSNSRYRSAKSRIYREFLGLDSCNLHMSEGTWNHRLQRSSPESINNISSSNSMENEQAQHQFRQKRQFFEEKFKRNRNVKKEDTFDTLEKKILDSCNSLDTTVNSYERYLTNYYNNRGKYIANDTRVRTPTEYLQHLVQLRREVVKADCDSTDCSLGEYRK